MTPSLTRVLDVARSLGCGTWEELADACATAGVMLLGSTPHPDTNRIWPAIVKLQQRGLLAHAGPHRWTLPDADLAHRTRAARAAAELSALLVARAHRLAADMIREREAMRVQACAWCGKRATGRDEDGSPACPDCATDRAGWAAHDRIEERKAAKRKREIADVYESETRT